MSTPSLKRISAEDLEAVFRSSPALLLGSDQTLGAASAAESNSVLGSHFDHDPQTTVWETAELLLATGAQSAAIREVLRDYFASQSTPPDLVALTSIRWSCVLSLSPDYLFEPRFDKWLAKNITRGAIATIDDASDIAPPRTVPIYKLLGTIQNDRFPITRNELLLRKARWSAFLSQAADRIRAGAMLAVGTSSQMDLLLELLATMLADHRVLPSRLIFLRDDPTINDPRITELVAHGLRVNVAETTAGGFRDSYRSQIRSGRTLPLAFASDAPGSADEFQEFADLAVNVNSMLATTVKREDTRLLFDILFSPTSPRWDPFAHSLDFERTASDEIREAVIEGANRADAGLHVVSVVAPSASGKTTILKRVAYDLAQAAFRAFWFRPYFFQDGPSETQKLFERARELWQKSDRPTIVFVDDPIGLGTTRIADIRASLERVGLPAVLVVGVRASELESLDADISLGSTAHIYQVDVPTDFDEQEWQRLPAYLLKLGVVRSLEHAEQRVADAKSKSVPDTLSTLYWLLPESRRSITESVKDEYFRLGDRHALSEVIIGEMNATSSLLKEAYGMVACAEQYGTGVPIEVLVSALGVGYSEWLQATPATGLVWGLLYQEEHIASESTIYRTRNAVVSDTIVRQVNGGLLGHAGEIERVKRLLAACNGSAPAYREFCLRILVPKNEARLDKLTYDEGARLYSAAMDALPHNDPTLLHHFGRWERRKGHDYNRARDKLIRALRAKPYPYSSRREAPEHIYTTMAANARDGIRSGALSPDDGTREALRCLDRARSAKFINAQATHVQATLIGDLADLRGGTPDADFFALVDRALSEIDRMILLLESDFSATPQARKDREMLETKRDDILDRVFSDDELETYAEDLWKEHHRIDAFVVLARRRYRRACQTNKGSDYRIVWEYCEQLCQRLRDEKMAMSRSLAECMLHLRVRWQVRRGQLSGMGNPIDWESIRTLASAVLEFPERQDDPYYKYLKALSSAHLMDWPEANALFDQLRASGLGADTLWESRDFLMNEEGGMRRVEGRMNTGAGGKRFVSIPELQTDMPVDRSARWPDDDSSINVYVHFRFAGAQAVIQP